MKQVLLDLGTDSPRTLSPENMSDALACALVQELYLMDLPDDNDWREEFIINNIKRKFFSTPQKKVIYDLAFKYQIL
jgi:hypothetical protein